MPVAISNLSATWSNSNLAFTAISMNVANNGSNADSRLFDLKVDGSSRQYVTPNGDIYITGYYHGDGSMLTGIIAGGGSTDNIARLIANTAYDKANSANILAFQVGGAVTTANTIASAAYDKANAANLLAFSGGGSSIIASAAFDKANAANLLAFNTGAGANTYLLATIAGANTAVGAGANAYANLVWSRSNTFTSATIAGANTAVGTGANAFTSATIAGANTAVGTGANTFLLATIAGANTAVGTGANAFSVATFSAANNTPVGNTLASLFTSRSTRRSLNFLPGTNITINVDDDSVGNRANITVSSTAGTGDVSTATLNGANTAVGAGANAFTSATIAGANTAVGTGANTFLLATIAGANTAVGTGANNFTSATIAGANTAVGTAANNFTSATIAGANTAVGTAANNFTSATIAGANTAVGTAANNFASATIAGANTAVGNAANNFASVTIAGANTAVGTAANNFAISTFGAANNTPVGNTLASTFTSRSTRRSLNFIPGTNITINIDDDSAGNRANITISSTSGGDVTTATLNGANTAVGAGANTYLLATIAGANTAVGTGANTYLLATIAGANTAVGTGANTYLLATIAGSNTAVGTGANAFTSVTIAGANTAVGNAANNFASATIAGANTAVGTAANNFSIATFGAANNTPVGNTLASLFTSRSTRRSLNFIPGTNITINVDDDSAGNRANITVSSTAGSGDVTTATLNGANTAVGGGANAFTSATIAGANTAVGAAANNFASATIAGANTAVGTGANTYLLATIAGANTAVGAGANTYLLATIAGANTAVGTGANTYLLATIAGANTAVGTGANAFTSATIAGANTAVGAGANTVAAAAFAKANATTYTSNVVISVADNTNAALRITQTGTGDALRVEDSANPDASPFVVDANGSVLIGTTSARSNFLNASLASAGLQIEGIASTNSSMSIVRDGASSNPPRMFLAKSRGATVGSNGLVQSGDILGSISFEGNDGAEFVEGAKIDSVVDGTAASDSMPSRLEFHTSSAASLIERMRIDASGNVGIGTTSPAYKLEVAGSFAAQTKSFVINHPTKEGQFLRYGSLEGPENGVYVRGKLEGKSIIELPDYWWNLVDENTITVNLTPYGRSQDIWVQSTSSHFIYLNQPADCFFTVFAERKDVDKLVVEY